MLKLQPKFILTNREKNLNIELVRQEEYLLRKSALTENLQSIKQLDLTLDDEKTLNNIRMRYKIDSEKQAFSNEFYHELQNIKINPFMKAIILYVAVNGPEDLTALGIASYARYAKGPKAFTDVFGHMAWTKFIPQPIIQTLNFFAIFGLEISTGLLSIVYTGHTIKTMRSEMYVTNKMNEKIATINNRRKNITAYETLEGLQTAIDNLISAEITVKRILENNNLNYKTHTENAEIDKSFYKEKLFSKYTSFSRVFFGSIFQVIFVIGLFGPIADLFDIAVGTNFRNWLEKIGSATEISDEANKIHERESTTKRDNVHYKNMSRSASMSNLALSEPNTPVTKKVHFNNTPVSTPRSASGSISSSRRSIDRPIPESFIKPNLCEALHDNFVHPVQAVSN